MGAVYFQRVPYHILLGKGKKSEIDLDEGLSFLTHNICAPWGGYPIGSGVLPWKERIDFLIQEIIEKNPDCICLQEVFDNRAAFALYRGLEKVYPYFYVNIGIPKDCIRCNSGLFFASKKPMDQVEFIPFNSTTILPNSRWVNKGFFYVKLTQGPLLYVVHLQHSENDNQPTLEEVEIRRKQMDAIFQHIKKKTDIEKGPILLLGDCNLYGKEFEKSILKRHFQNAYVEKKPTWLGNELIAKLWNLPLEAKGKDLYILDYTLLLESLPGEDQNISSKYNLQTQLVPMASLFFPLSDHEGLYTKIHKYC